MYKVPEMYKISMVLFFLVSISCFSCKVFASNDSHETNKCFKCYIKYLVQDRPNSPNAIVNGLNNFHVVTGNFNISNLNGLDIIKSSHGFSFSNSIVLKSIWVRTKGKAVKALGVHFAGNKCLKLDVLEGIIGKVSFGTPLPDAIYAYLSVRKTSWGSYRVVIRDDPSKLPDCVIELTLLFKK